MKKATEKKLKNEPRKKKIKKIKFKIQEWMKWNVR